MSIITLFNANNPITALNAQSASYYSESEKNISEKFKNIQQFEPPIDFTTASNWCRYGSLELYYEYGFKRVYNTYPYDGSAYEKNLYRNNSSQIDNYIFDSLYPKSTGYAVFMSNAGTQSLTASAGGVTYSLAVSPEYITVLGGPNTASAGMEGKPLHQTFDDSNKYDPALRRESNLEFDFSYGNTVEFWLNKGTFFNINANEVIFDLSNGGTIAGSDAGRLTIELDPGASGGSPFVVTIESGSSAASFTLGSDITTGTNSSGHRVLSNSNEWHHYAFAFLSSSLGTRVNFFQDGNLTETKTSSIGFARVTGSLKSNIGALVAATTAVTGAAIGYGQLSGSIDEFRYWKYDRPADLIKLNYFKGIDGGTNTDDESYQLGVYYKFNEGITQTASVDSVVLDYSGRISNGTWTGYNTGSRNTGSAITLSGVETEVGDPIVRSNHPDIVSTMADLAFSGSVHDQENHTYFYNLFPEWIRSEDIEESDLLRQLAHIGASYFDTIHHQLDFYKNVKNKEYLSSSAKPITFADSLVENLGLTVSNLFVNSKIYEKVLNQDENELYEQTLFDVKNQIYHNIYNNIHSILKSKGTVDGFRNFLRSFGVNEEIIKLRMYTDNDQYFLNDNYQLQTEPIKFVNFYNADNLGASVIQATSSISDTNFIDFSEAADERYSSFTMEANVLFPKKFQAGEAGYVGMTNISSSLFGFHRPDASTPADYTWQDAGFDLSNLQVYAVKDSPNGRDVKFQLRDNANTPTINLESSFIQEVYDNSTWNISVRLKPSGSVFTGFSGYGITSPDYILEFYGVNYHNGEQQKSFFESKVLSSPAEKRLISSDKRFYIGAHRTNFTGAVLQQADSRISAFRLWHSHLSNEELNSHARDFSSYGVLSGSKNPTIFENNISTYFPKIDSLAINWNFESVTGSDSSGNFLVYDISSGSATGLTQYGWHGNSVGTRNGGQGIDFLTSSAKVVDKNYIITARTPEPGNALLDDLVNIREEFEALQTDYNDVTDNFFSIEKSPYAVLTTEMLKFFSLSKDLNYLVGNPVNRYRVGYKELEDLKEIYFRNVENEIDVERYFDYYKWIDRSFNEIIKQLIPFSTRHSENVSNVVESHLLERPKYQHKFPILRKFTATEAAMQGFAALNYNWNTGHAPVSSNPNVNCEWQLRRRERTGTNSTEREALRKTINGVHPLEKINLFDITGSVSYEGSTYVRTALNKQYKISIEDDKVIHSGINYSTKKDRLLFHEALQPHGLLISVPQNIITIGVGPGQGIVSQGDCDDNVLTKVNFSSNTQLGKFVGDEYRHELKGHKILPHNLKNEVLQTGYNAQVSSEYKYDVVFTNLHTDTIDSSNVIPMQGPFTETHVGGHQSRHIPINRYDANKTLIVTSEVGASQASGTIEFTLSDLTVGDTITITDADLNDIVAEFSTYFDIDEARWTTTDQLIEIINQRLDVTASLASTSPDLIDLRANSFGTDGNQPLATSNSTDITIVGMTGGAAGSTTSATYNVDGPGNRPEAWGLVTKEHSSLNPDNDGAFGFVGADYGGAGSYPNTAKLRATRYRDEHAKRPLNIRNIQYDENSSFVGNYRRGLEIVQIPRSVNRRWFRDAYDLGLVLPTSISSSLPNTTNYFTLVAQGVQQLGNIFGLQENSGRYLAHSAHPTPRTDLTSSTYEIVTRFSAPGGPEVQTIGHLDAQSQTFSPYNAMPFRNLTVRGRSSGESTSGSAGRTIRAAIHVHPDHYPYGEHPTTDRRGLRTLLQQRMGPAGTDHEDPSSESEVLGSSYPTFGSFQKQHPNRRIGFELVGQDNQGRLLTSTKLTHDNGYVNRPIPSQDVGYSWISNLYAQGSGSLSDAPTVASLNTVVKKLAQRWTNFTPEQLFDLLTDTFTFGQLEDAKFATVVGYAHPSGRQPGSIGGSGPSVLVSSHIFPTISDIACCVEGADVSPPTITVITPNQDLYQDGVVVDTIFGTTQTTNFSLEVEEEAEDVQVVSSGPAEIWEQKIENITYNGVSNDECCPPLSTKYAMTVHGTQFDEPSQTFSESADPGPPLDSAYSSTKPNFPSSLGSDVKINCKFGSEVGGDLGLATAEVVVTIYAKDCQDRVTSLQITFLDAYWEAV